MKGRTVILVTHHVNLVLPHCAWVVQLNEGTVATQGRPAELQKQDLLATNTGANLEETTILDDTVKEPKEQGDEKDDKVPNTLVEKEEKAEYVMIEVHQLLSLCLTCLHVCRGRVNKEVYRIYFAAASYALVVLLLVFVVLRHSGKY